MEQMATNGYNILKNKELTGKLSNCKRLGRIWRTANVDGHRILSSQVQNTLKGVTVSLSKSTAKRWLHELRHTHVTKMCKPLVMIKDKKAKLDFKIHWEKIHWTDETKNTFYQNDGKRKL